MGSKKTLDGELKRRGLISTLSLFFQSGYSALLGFVANLIITILLSPKVFGLYIAVLSIIAFLNYFSDIGLAASLIQKKELHDDDIKTTFTVQQLLIISLVLIGFFATKFIASFYNLPQAGIYLYWALLAGFFISSLKTIPSILLERSIQFQKIVFVQIVENTVFYTAVSILAIMGFGISSFTIAVLLRSVVGLILMYSISFWMPRIGISLRSLRTLLSFGVPFQASSFLAIFKDDLIILYLGKVLGFEALGYIGWAKKWADAPIRIVMDNVNKVIFPLIARVQDDMKKVPQLFNKILYYQSLILIPIFIGMIMVMKPFLTVIPNYQKWEVALPLLYIFCVSSLILSFFAPFMNLFNALGKVKLSFSFMALFTLVIWAFTPLLTSQLGLFGFPLAHLFVSISFVGTAIAAQRLVEIDILKPTLRFLIAGAVMGLGLYLVINYVGTSSKIFVLSLPFFGLALYMIVLRTMKVAIFSEMKKFINIMKKSNK